MLIWLLVIQLLLYLRVTFNRANDWIATAEGVGVFDLDLRIWLKLFEAVVLDSTAEQVCDTTVAVNRKSEKFFDNED